jgi:hypothetical protein
MAPSAPMTGQAAQSNMPPSGNELTEPVTGSSRPSAALPLSLNHTVPSGAGRSAVIDGRDAPRSYTTWDAGATEGTLTIWLFVSSTYQTLSAASTTTAPGEPAAVGVAYSCQVA